MCTIEMKNLHKQFGNVEVIKGVDLNIDHGSFVVFVGPSGCGKSTLLRLIAGLENISRGDLLIDKQRVNDWPPTRRRISMVFQSYALYPHMKVYDNLAFGLKLAKHSKSVIQKRVEHAAETLAITELLHRYPKQLSGGQRQRVAIGRAIVREPKAFLFDEPLSNLDAALRVQMRIEITKLHEQIDATMIYVTHDQVEAMTLADTIVVLNEGRIEQVGKPCELYNRPANRFVAGFMGSPKMNFIKSRVMQRDEYSATCRLPGDQTMSVKVDTRSVSVGDSIELGVRPENLQFSNNGGPNLDAEVYAVEQLGDVRYLYAKLADGQSVTVRHLDNNTINRGSLIPLVVDSDRCHVFNETGKAL